MNRIVNSFNVLVYAFLLFLLGVAATAVRVAGDAATVSAYNSAVESAREKAVKGIVYYAKQDYLKAFSLYADDRELYQEFLEFLETSGDESYRTYLKIYVEKYPEDPEAYEKLCEIYLGENRYKEVQNLLLSASGFGVKSEALAQYWDDVRYKFTYESGSYQNISTFYGTQAIVEKNGKKGIYYLGSGLALKTIYEDLSYIVDGMLVVKDAQGWYFADSMGNKLEVPDRDVDSLSILSNGFSAVSVDGRYGYMTTSLEVPEHLPYEYASVFSNGVAAVKSDGKWGIVNTQGEYVAGPVYEEIKLTEFGTAVSAGVIFVKEGGFWRMMDTEGSYVSDLQFEEVETFLPSGQPAAVKLEGRWTFVKNDGELYEVPREVFAVKSFNNGLAPVTLDGINWGYMDAQGESVIEPQFADCRQFSEYGAAPVKKGEVWSVIRLLLYQ